MPKELCLIQSNLASEILYRISSRARMAENWFTKKRRDALLKDYISSYQHLVSCPVKDLACQITLDEAELFRHIEVSEFMDQNWENETTGPAISLLVARYNKISNWVAFSILDLFEEKAQLAIYCKFVKLAQQLHDVQNYNSCTAILGGLSDASVARLKRISSVREPFFPLRPRHDLTIHSESS